MFVAGGVQENGFCLGEDLVLNANASFNSVYVFMRQSTETWLAFSCRKMHFDPEVDFCPDLHSRFRAALVRVFNARRLVHTANTCLSLLAQSVSCFFFASVNYTCKGNVFVLLGHSSFASFCQHNICQPFFFKLTKFVLLCPSLPIHFF